MNHEHEADLMSPCLACYRLGAKARASREGRKPCLYCGMVGNIDPGLHRKRYGHAPVLA